MTTIKQPVPGFPGLTYNSDTRTLFRPNGDTLPVVLVGDIPAVAVGDRVLPLSEVLPPPNEAWVALGPVSVSNYGRVLLTKTGRLLPPIVGLRSEPRVGFSLQGQPHKVRVSVLVALAFLGEPPAGATDAECIDRRAAITPANVRWCFDGELRTHAGVNLLSHVLRPTAAL